MTKEEWDNLRISALQADDYKTAKNYIVDLIKEIEGLKIDLECMRASCAQYIRERDEAREALKAIDK